MYRGRRKVAALVLARPASERGELRHWFRGCPVDFSAFTPAQICYTASPIIKTGVDILPNRLELMPGPAVVRVPPPEALQPPPPPPPKPLREIGNYAAANYARAALTNAAVRIMAAGEGNRHRKILSEARSLRRLVDAGAISEAHARQVIESAARHAGKSDEHEIAGLWAWASAHPSEGRAHV